MINNKDLDTEGIVIEPSSEAAETAEKTEANNEDEAENVDKADDAGDGSVKSESEDDSNGSSSEEDGDKKNDAEETKESDDAKYVRLAADFQNYKRRVEKEKQDIYSYANEKIAIDIIDVMDNFERAMMHSDESSDKSFAEGMNMILKQMKSLLDKHNIIEIEAEGIDFDPRFHNAVMTEEKEGCESGKVIQVFQKGYTLKGKVIRPSMVKVSQ